MLNTETFLWDDDSDPITAEHGTDLNGRRRVLVSRDDLVYMVRLASVASGVEPGDRLYQIRSLVNRPEVTVWFSQSFMLLQGSGFDVADWVHESCFEVAREREVA